MNECGPLIGGESAVVDVNLAVESFNWHCGRGLTFVHFSAQPKLFSSHHHGSPV